MKKHKVIIVGAGGHGKVLAETIALLDGYKIIGFADDNTKTGTDVFNGIKVICTFDEVAANAGKAEYFVGALGNNTLRECVYKTNCKSLKPLTVIHPYSFVAPSAQIGEGAIILAGAVVSSGCVVGKNTIINSLALIDHDSAVGDHCHIAPGTVLGSNSYIASRKFTKIGEVFPSFSKV
jgi:sugar O-acyltransferase (sialic acid O-acetyltransferase NeuD family)